MDFQGLQKVDQKHIKCTKSTQKSTKCEHLNKTLQKQVRKGNNYKISQPVAVKLKAPEIREKAISPRLDTLLKSHVVAHSLHCMILMLRKKPISNQSSMMYHIQQVIQGWLGHIGSEPVNQESVESMALNTGDLWDTQASKKEI